MSDTSDPKPRHFLDNVVIPPQLLGMPNIFSSFPQFISAPRANMFNHHTAQAMVLNNPEFNKIFTGNEGNFLEYGLDGSKREYDCEVIGIYPKYSPPLVSREDCPEIFVLVLNFLPNGKRELDYFTIDRYFLGTNGYGYIPQLENRHLIAQGAIISKGEVITHSPRMQGGQYCPGVNLKTIYGSFPESTEDAFIISESAARKLTATEVKQVIINFRQDRRPLNINGNEYEDKFLPDIGSYVRDDGLLFAARPVHWTTVPADSDRRALREFLPLQDEAVYVQAGAKIVDLTFNINRNRSKLNNCYDQARLYSASNTRCWKEIYRVGSMYANKAGVSLSAKMSTLMTTAIYHMVANESIVPSLEEDFRRAMKKSEISGFGGQPVDFIQAVVTYTCDRPITPGSKLTDYSGSKGVVGMVYPDDWMPVDEYGERAELWIDMHSPVSRNNPAQLYETGINRISEFVRRKCQSVYELRGAEPAFDTLMDWYGDVNPNYEDFIRRGCQNTTDRKRVVVDAIENGPRLCIPPTVDTLMPTKDDRWNALSNIQRWAKKWDVRSTPVTYKCLQPDGTGKQFTTKASFAIGSKYIIHLHKIPEITAPGPASVNHIGIPTKSTYDAKYFTVSTNPYRFGEDELRVMSMDCDTREVVRFQALMANSPVGTNLAIQTLLLSDHPTRIKRIPISNGKLAQMNSINNLFHSVAACLGMETKDTLTDQRDVPDELEDAVWNTNLDELDPETVGRKRGPRGSTKTDDDSEPEDVADDGDDAE